MTTVGLIAAPQLSSLHKAALAGLSVFGPAALLLVTVGANDRDGAIWLTLAAVAAAVSVPLLVAILRGTIDVFEPVYLTTVAYGLYFVFAPLADLVADNLVYFGTDVRPHVVTGLALVVPSLLAMFVGYYSKIGHFIAMQVPPPSEARRGAVRYGIVLALAGLLGFMIYLVTEGRSLLALVTLGQFSGGLDVDMTDPSPLRNYLKSMVNWLIGAFLLLFAFQRRMRWLLVPFYVGLLVTYVSLGFRFRVLILLMAPFIFSYLRQNSRPAISRLIAAGTLLFMMIGIVGAVRTRIRTAQPLRSVSTAAVLAAFSRSLAIYQPYLMIVDAFPRRHAFPYGASVAYLIYQPIPRRLWPEKPEAPIRGITRAAFDSDQPVRSGVAYPNIAEYYANFGLAGMLLGMFLFGALIRVPYEYLRLFPENDWVRVFYAITLPYLVQVVSRGYLVQTTVELVFFLAPVAGGMWLLNRGFRFTEGIKQKPVGT